MNVNRKGYTPPGTKHARTVRTSPCGHPVPVDHTPAPTWHELVVPAPKPVGVRRPFTVDVPAPMRVLTESKDVQGPVVGQPSRRERRKTAVAQAAAERKAARRAVPRDRKARAA